MILWETFDRNELYILTLLVLVFIAFFAFPKKLPRHITWLFLIWGFAISTLFDFTIGGGLLDYYKVNDSNKYELTDLITYFSFAPISYFFVYFYHRFQIKRKTFITYILGWTVAGLLMEQLSRVMNVIHYQNGYNWTYSIAVFLVTLTITALYYTWVSKKEG
ncbi:hypothetical protein SAMN05216238_101338 [Lentibacillus persicus]|uniref:Uncharacterized protein n=1 Tax=Lentibacillus persicus TaxID=640948 RepID=A0A1I1SGQ6_9BACI|nr:hypothetical protein [Lentibacillus persicus]SFD43818.1 hypothetical protein SAMN05216238_101338 [Lentibacillus persicus]